VVKSETDIDDVEREFSPPQQTFVSHGVIVMVKKHLTVQSMHLVRSFLPKVIKKKNVELIIKFILSIAS